MGSPAAAAKIKSLEDLAQITASLRARRRRVVHCHGVFDLLHIGHIRHFEQARRHGDVVVVTVTPDRFVNKGPQRPAFPEALRLEAIAALACVDYVALNRFPTSVEAIRLLKPHVYVKGSDYRNGAADVTGGIRAEASAVHAVGGRVAFTADLTFSSSALLNRHVGLLPRETLKYLDGFRRRHPPAEVLRYLDGARRLRVLVIGEAIIDEYQYCAAIGKSSKEPILAVQRLSTERFAGGVLAVANHIAGFCDRVDVLTGLGRENPQEDFIRAQLHPRVRPRFLYRRHIPTIVKRRFIEQYFFTKMMEVYEIDTAPPSARERRAFCAALESALPRYDLVVVVDYGHGLIVPEAVRLLCRRARFLTVNAQTNAGNVGFHAVSKYPQADFLTASETEIRMEARDRGSELKGLLRRLLKRLRYRRLIITRGKYGCLGYDRREGFIEVPAVAGQVVDRMGTGDALLSVAALYAVQNAPLEVLEFVGNAAGAQAVATIGHRAYLDRAGLEKHVVSLLK